MTESMETKISPQRMALAFMAACLVAVVITSFVYRLKNPAFEIQRQNVTEDHEHGEMDQMRQLMLNLEKNPNDIEALGVLSGRFMEMGAWNKAEIFLRRILKIDSNNTLAHYMLGICLFQMDQHEAAAREFEAELRIKPDDAAAHYNLGILFKYYLKKPAQAKASFKKVLDLKTDDASLNAQAQKELETAPKAAN